MLGWLIAAAVVILLCAAMYLVALRDTVGMLSRAKSRRPNPSRTEFIATLSRDVKPETAEFLWERMAFLLPTFAPHPNDHLWHDLPIAESEPMNEWLAEFAARHGASVRNWPEWPAGSPCTVRNYACWLELELERARS